MKKILSFTLAFGLLLSPTVLAADKEKAPEQKRSPETISDEQTLRNLVQQENEGRWKMEYVEDAVFVSGLYPRPFIGRERIEQSRAGDKERMEKARPNQRTKAEILKLAVSKSGDMAEEFGNFAISFDGPNNDRQSFEGSYLRVWRKTDNGWKVSSFFARPNRPAAQE